MCSMPKHTETRLPGKDGTSMYKYTHPLATHLSMSRGWTCRLKSQFHELHRPIYDFKIPMIEVFCQRHGFFLHWLLTRGLMTIESTGLKQWNTLGHRVVTEFSALNFHQIDSPLFATAHPLARSLGAGQAAITLNVVLNAVWKYLKVVLHFWEIKCWEWVCGKHIATEGKAFVVRFFLVLDARAAVAAAEASKIVQPQRPAGKYHHSPP